MLDFITYTYLVIILSYTIHAYYNIYTSHNTYTSNSKNKTSLTVGIRRRLIKNSATLQTYINKKYKSSVVFGL